ncbi:MAG: ABC transporter permease [Bacteroidota bacterium]
MRMPIISSIYNKEIREVLRDKRMLYLVILMPFFLYPVMFYIMGKASASSENKVNTELVDVYINTDAQASPIIALLEQDTTLTLHYEDLSTAEKDSLSGKKIALQLPAVLNDTATLKSSEIFIYGDNSEEVVSNRRRRITGLITAYNQQLANERLAGQGLSPDFIQPIKVTQTNTASERALAGMLMGTIVPIMLLLFVFLGCIYIAIDTTAGEKERKTLQTIYTTPVSTNEIIGGKFLAVATIGLVSAFANLGSLLFSMRLQTTLMGAGEKASSLFQFSLGGMDIFWLVLLLMLATVFMAALCMGVVLLANSYKEAQSYVSPLMMVVLIPSVMATMPGMELNMQTAMVPMFNICLAMAELFKGDYNLTLIGVVAIFALLYGLFGLWIASRTFGNENVVTGEKVNWKSLLR